MKSSVTVSLVLQGLLIKSKRLSNILAHVVELLLLTSKPITKFFHMKSVSKDNRHLCYSYSLFRFFSNPKSNRSSESSFVCQKSTMRKGSIYSRSRSEDSIDFRYHGDIEYIQ